MTKDFIVLCFLALLYSVASICDEKCLECSEAGNCQACIQSAEYNQQGQCHDKDIDKCIIYGLSDECLLCQPTYSLKNNTCVQNFIGCTNGGDEADCYECGYGTILRNSTCVGVINCDISNEGLCLSCKPQFYLLNNICVDLSQGCILARSNGLCQKCLEGYFYSGYRCFKNIYKNQRCYILENNVRCLYCKIGFIYDNGNCLLKSEFIALYIKDKQAFSYSAVKNDLLKYSKYFYREVPSKEAVNKTEGQNIEAEKPQNTNIREAAIQQNKNGSR